MMEFLLGAALVAIWFSLENRWWRTTVDYRHPRLLMYHMVSPHRPGAKFNKLRVPPERFEEQIKYLSESGWYFAHVSELAHPLPEKTVVITFDDGYQDNLIYADKVLATYGAKATLYLVVERFDRDWSTAKKAHHDSGELMREPKLTDAEVTAMLASRRWELGAHTLTHANLPTLNHDDRRREIIQGKRTLEAQFQVEVASFAYPFGIYDATDIRLAQEAGFQFAVTTIEGIDDLDHVEPLELRRVKISGKERLWQFALRLRTGRRK